MSVLAWILLGLIAGFVASRIVAPHSGGALLDIFLGMVGALVGGYLFQLFGAEGVTGLNLWSLVVATTGSIVLLLAYHAIRRTSLAR
jgi:uncharacterized membrane protein YeaQ/YmgE (transglycosylase-associated protein family)